MFDPVFPRRLAIAIVLAAAACGGGGTTPLKVDASADKPQTCATAAGPGSGMNGQACSCDGDCQSQFCVDGGGACRPMPAGTSCGTASCTGSTAMPVGTCDGSGGCRQIATSCGAYLCGPTACNTTCATAADCVAGYSCLGSSCTNLKANGAVCGSAAECISGFCTEGFCCGATSCGTCRSCAVAGSQGTCSPIADGTVCGAALCDGQDRYRAAATCVAGTCTQATARTECAPYACDVVAVCRTSCASDADCAKKNKCTIPASGPGTCGPS